MLKLFHAPRSPFASKARILVHELGLAGRVEFEAVDPWSDEALRRLNPLCKVPTLVLEDGTTALYDSVVIGRYLVELGGGGLIPPPPAAWEALRHEALGDGLAEAVIRRHVEGLGPESERSSQVRRRQEAAIAAALNELDRLARPAEREITIGHVATAAALTYLSFRSPEIAWREGRDALSQWFATFSQRPSVRAAYDL
jgi:glutathione S-transferase